MKIKSYEPLDGDYHIIIEYLIDSNLPSKKEPTGKKYRKISNYIPTGTDAHKAFIQELRQKDRIIMYLPHKVCVYELLSY